MDKKVRIPVVLTPQICGVVTEVIKRCPNCLKIGAPLPASFKSDTVGRTLFFRGVEVTIKDGVKARYMSVVVPEFDEEAVGIVRTKGSDGAMLLSGVALDAKTRRPILQ